MPLIPLEGATVHVNPENGAFVLRYGGYTLLWQDRAETQVFLAIRNVIEETKAKCKDGWGKPEPDADSRDAKPRVKRKAVGTD